MRLSQIHDTLKPGLVSHAIQIAREKRESAYIGDGLNRWPAAHRRDTPRLYRLVLEKGEAGFRYNAVGEEGISTRKIAEVIGRGLNVPVVSIRPEEAAELFGRLAPFAGLDVPASSKKSRNGWGWQSAGLGPIADRMTREGEDHHVLRVTHRRSRHRNCNAARR